METFWAASEPLPVRAVHTNIRRRAYTTIETVIGRLVERNLLSRERARGVYVYRATETRAAFVSRQIAAVIASLT